MLSMIRITQSSIFIFNVLSLVLNEFPMALDYSHRWSCSMMKSSSYRNNVIEGRHCLPHAKNLKCDERMLSNRSNNPRIFTSEISPFVTERHRCIVTNFHFFHRILAVASNSRNGIFFLYFFFHFYFYFLRVDISGCINNKLCSLLEF